MRRTGALAAAALAGVLTASCLADPPQIPPGGGTTPRHGPHASLASCSPRASCTDSSCIPTCPGSSCAQNATNAPDGIGVALDLCDTLELTFTDGEVVAGRVLPDGGNPPPDLMVYLTTVAGITRVEASLELQAQSFVIVGYIGGLETGADPRCRAAVTGNVAAVYFDRCNFIRRAKHLRFIRVPGSTGALGIDAVRATEFRMASN